MDVNGFWTLLERSGQLPGAPCARAERLTALLAELPPAEVLAFQQTLDAERAPADTYPVYAAARLIHGGFCSDDSFWYFQAWLLGLGRDAFRQAVADPDSLAAHPAVQRLAAVGPDQWSDHDDPSWEELDQAAAEAYARLTGGDENALADALADLGHDSPLWPETTGTPLSAAEAATRLPRLTALFAPPA